MSNRLLLNPKRYDRVHPDDKTRQVMEKTIDFFERKGLKSLKEDDQHSRWYDDFLRFIKEERVFATLLTPAGYGEPDSRFDLTRVCEYNEITAFYSLAHQYCYQVSILGLGPIWMGDNEEVKRRTAQLLSEGGIFGFGMSERAHGADLYSNKMKLFPDGKGGYLADGGKYYIGNANEAALISTFGRYADNDEFVFFVVSPQHRNYKLVKKISTSGVRPAYVGEYELIGYPITRGDILSSGARAWDAGLSTVNIGKFQLGFASIGICTHALYEAINHASNRVLYGKKVTDFPHIKKIFVDSYCRLIAMKLYALRSLDYFRSSSAQDRRYLLFNPIQKMKVTTQAMKVIDMLLDAIVAKGFEQETYFESAIRDIGMIPRLEGTTHVNIALVIKFMRNYFFNPVDYPEIPRRDEPGDDSYLFAQTTGGLSGVTFPDYRRAYRGVELPNVKVFLEQVELFRGFLADAAPDAEQSRNIDYMLALGEMFTLIVYAQLIMENCRIYQIGDELVEGIFNLLIREFSHYALDQVTNYANTGKQEQYLREMMKKPVLNQEQENRLWTRQVSVLNGVYE
ncbi:MAG: acyl-CoA dehydrogenase [Firmicutes bacterium]|nr:acyl-CoA dehydrogenase [Bacillota bacterium]